METSLTGGEPQTTDTFTILSFCSWIMLIIASWMPIWYFGMNKNKIMFFWLIAKYNEFDKKEVNFILDINFVVFAINYFGFNYRNTWIFIFHIKYT